MAVRLPCVVWVDIRGTSKLGPDPRWGLLVQWRQRVDRRGSTYWEGLVVTATPDVEDISASIALDWRRAYFLTPVEMTPPGGPSGSSPDLA